MTAGLAGVAVTSPTAPIWVWSALMWVVGLSGPATMPSTMGRLLSHVPDQEAGTASGVFNPPRQLGGALRVALFGALVSHDDFERDPSEPAHRRRRRLGRSDRHPHARTSDRVPPDQRGHRKDEHAHSPLVGDLTLSYESLDLTGDAG